MEKVDILLPPDFHPSGQTKILEQAQHDGDWLGGINLWIIQSDPQPAIIYQLRNPDAPWMPNKLDASAGGYYSTGESGLDGLREAKEEIGKDYSPNETVSLGRRLNVSTKTDDSSIHTIANLYLIKDNSPIESFTLQPEEVHAICACPIADLLKVHIQDNYSFEVSAINNQGKQYPITVNKDSFPYNWDNYHYKMALIAQRFLNGETNLIY